MSTILYISTYIKCVMMILPNTDILFSLKLVTISGHPDFEIGGVQSKKRYNEYEMKNEQDWQYE